jgi:hypothetical protein
MVDRNLTSCIPNQVTDKKNYILEGNVLGQPSNWRRAKLVRKFTDVERNEFDSDRVDGSVKTELNSGHRTYTSGWNDPEVVSAIHRSGTHAKENGDYSCFKHSVLKFRSDVSNSHVQEVSEAAALILIVLRSKSK